MAVHTWWGNDPGNVGDWSVAANWDGGVPIAAGDVHIPAGSAAISAGLNQSGVALGIVDISEGYTGAIGTYTGAFPVYLQVDCNELIFNGTGESFIDLSHVTGSINVTVLGTASPATGKRGLYLQGDDIADLVVKSGFVGVAAFRKNSQNVTTLSLDGVNADVITGNGSVVTNVNCNRGTCLLRGSTGPTQIDQVGGTLTTELGAITTYNLHGGTFISNSLGTLTTLNLEGGTADFSQFGDARTLTTLVQNGGVLKYDPSVLTITNRNAPTRPVSQTVVLLT